MDKRKVVSRETVIERVKEAVIELKRQIPIDCVYLFGSYAKGTPKPYSDVDIAIVSPEFGKNYINETVFMMEIFHGTGLIVEPHAYSREELENTEKNTFLYEEVLQKGIKIA
jgi:predicted nucleotidyltransferase